MWCEHGDHGDLVIEIAIIAIAHYHTEHHMENAKDNGDFHFVAIVKDDLVAGRNLPNRIHAKRIRRIHKTRLRIQLQIIVFHHCRRIVFDLPVRTEYVQRFGEDIVVNETGVHRECAHQEDNVSAAEENVPDL